MSGSSDDRFTKVSAPASPAWVRFDRHEVAGAFGDLGTSLPLLTGMILAAGFQPGAVLATFGMLQISSGFLYGLPMSVQPLKAVAALVVAGQLRAGVVWGAGIAIGLGMLVLNLLGLVAWLGRRIPLPVVRGLQLALGFKLAVLALGTFVPADGLAGFALATVSIVVLLTLHGYQRVPVALLVLLLGAGYALAGDPSLLAAAPAPRLVWPAPAKLEVGDLLNGALLLALPQLPLSLANSIFATERTVRDLFPHRRVSARRLAITYAAMNLLAPWGGGVPVCHGAGGIAGHHAFGARTGGSVVVCGVMFLVGGLAFGESFATLVRLVPMPTLGILLAREALSMAKLAVNLPPSREAQALMLLTAGLAAFLPFGFGIGLVVGALADSLLRRRKCRV